MTPHSLVVAATVESNVLNQAQDTTTSQVSAGMHNSCYGKRLIVQTVDDLAVHEPDRVWATVPVSQDINDGFRDFTTLQLANAVNNLAHWLNNKFGQSSQFEVLAYLGVSDVRYAIILFAAIKCGYVVSTSAVNFMIELLYIDTKLSSWYHRFETQKLVNCMFSRKLPVQNCFILANLLARQSFCKKRAHTWIFSSSHL
jgi:hypothetical protein